MNLLYRLFLFLISGILFLIRQFSRKLSHFLEGRKFVFTKLGKFRDSYPGELAWFHVASLGEYEQARPVMALLKSWKPDLGIVVSFFSPSGYDHVVKRSNEPVDFITYIPLDRKHLAERFVAILRPAVTFFVKYDLWHHHIQALKNHRIPIFLIAASLREDQSYFGAFGGFFRQNLFAMNWIFTQNQKSVDLLQRIGYSNCSIAGDTRFDRVADTASAPKVLPEIKKWIGNTKTIVIGSAWDEDMGLLIPLINAKPAYRWIIAPHDLSPEPMERWSKSLSLDSKRFSDWDSSDSNSVLFIDNIGMLSSLYQFAWIAYVGGAFGKGLHNILEPLGFGAPVIFGKVKRASKFPEAEQSQQEGCGFAVSDATSLFESFEKLEHAECYRRASLSAQTWVNSNLGAADRIVEKVFQLTSLK